jgi:hypothetical protein
METINMSSGGEICKMVLTRNGWRKSSNGSAYRKFAGAWYETTLLMVAGAFVTLGAWVVWSAVLSILLFLFEAA